MRKGISGNGGFAIVYGLAVLFLATVSGISILHIASKDRVSATDYSKMRTAAVAARAALEAFEGQCSIKPENVVDILRQFKKTPSKKWLLGEVDNAGNEKKIKCWNGVDAPSFSACIIKFDSTNMLIQVQGTGYGGLGGKKKATGIYKLRGMQVKDKYKHRNAIFLHGSGRNFDQKINVLGNIYCGADIHFNSGASGSVINGDLKTGNSSFQSRFDASLTINGMAFFQTPIYLNSGALLTINGKSGFEKIITIDEKVDLYGDTYVNDAVAGHKRLDLNNNVITHSGKVLSFDIESGSASKIINNNGMINIEEELDMTSGNEQVFTAVIDSIPSSKIFRYSFLKSNNHKWQNFSVEELNERYQDAASNGDLWKGFLVIRIDQNANMKENNSGIFNGKVIWIIDKRLNCNSSWYDCSAASNTMVFVRSGGAVSDLGSKANFRGYVHVEGDGSVTYKWKSGNFFKGAIHHVSQSANYHMNSGDILNIEYDESVIDDFVEAGVVSPPGGNIGGLILNDVKLRPELLSICY